MKKLLFTFIFLATSITMMGQVPAFPGAEGHGRYVTGGRDGVVRHVTTLLDDGKASTQGTLRWAVSGNTKKIVVFDVAGVIALQSDLSIGANTTIAGQTAPHPGITLRYYTVRPNGDNIIIRFLRMRRGQEKDVNDGADASWCKEHKGIILDHCSFSWSIDEVASFYDNNNFTMQWCTLGESLNNAGHGKGAHGYGGIWGGKLASFHHNMICHVNNRSPRFNGARYNWTGYTGNDRYEEFYWDNAIQAENVDFRNCVIYNCGNGCYGGPGGGQINMVNNYYKSGPAGTTKYITTASVANSTSSSDHKEFWTMLSRYYITGNMIDGNSKNWDAVTYDKDATYIINGKRHTPDPNHFYGDNVTYSKNTSGTDCVQMELTSPTDYGTVTTHNAQTAFNKVLDYAGASLHRDNVDARYMKEAKNGTATYSGSVTGKPGRIDLVSDVNGYTEENFGTGNRPSDFDTDLDGMPDEWERLNGLDPTNKNDGKTITLDTEKGWYTNLEVYLSSLVEDIMKGGNADAQSSVNEYYPACVKMPEPTPPTPPTPTTNCSILWKFDTGAEGQQATLNGLAQNGIKSATVTLGSELKYNGKLTAGGLAETKIQQTKVNDTPTDANAITFSITPAKGYSLKPTSVMFTATRNGTNNGKIDAKWVDSNGTSVICSGVTPKRNNTPSDLEDQSPFYSTYSTDLDGDATTGECKLVINLYNLSFNGSSGITLKDYGFCNITIEGVMTAPEIIKGDVNGDGKVDMSDVTDLVQYILGNPSEDFNTDAADVNGDGEIGMPDVMFIIQYTINGKFPTE